MFLVGSKSGNYSSTATQNVTLTDLGTLLQNDIVLIAVSHAGTATRTLAQITPTGYTNINAAVLTSSDTNIISGSGFYKFMGATPDNSVTLPACAASTNSIAYSIEVWRGVDATTPFAGVAPTTATAINSGLANPPSVSTAATTKGQVVFGMGGGTGDSTQASAVFTNTGATPYDTSPAGPGHFTSSANTTATNRAVSFMGAKRGLAPSTAFDAAITGNNSGNRNAWWAIAFVLKPDATLSAASTLSDALTSGAVGSSWTQGFATTGYYDAAHAVLTALSSGIQVVPPSSFSTNPAYNGLYGNTYYSLRGSSSYIAFPLVLNDSAFVEQMFGFEGNANVGEALTLVFTGNGSGGKWQLRQGTTGGANTILVDNVAFNATNHFWVRIGHNDATDHVYVDAAPNSGGAPGTWTNIIDIARPATLNVDCLRPFFAAGAFSSVASPGTAKWAGFNTAYSTSIGLVLAAAASASVTDNISLIPKTALTVANASSTAANDNLALSFHNLLVIANDASSSTTTNLGSISVKYALVVAAAASQSVADAIVVTPRWAFSIANPASLSTADPLTISPKTTLTIGPASSLSVTDSPLLAPKTSLTVAGASSAGTTGNVVLSPKTSLTLAAALSTTVADNIVLAAKTALVLAAASSAAATDNVLLSAKTSLVVGPASSSSVTDTFAISPKTGLTIAPASSLSITDTLSLAPRTALVIAPAVSPSLVDQVIVSPVLLVADMISPAVVDTLTIAARTPLVVSDEASPSAADSLLLTARTMLAPDPANSPASNDNVTVSPRTSLALANGQSLSVVDGFSLPSGYVLGPSAMNSLTTAGQVSIAIRYALSVSSAVSLSFADNGTVVTAGSIAPSSAVSPSTVDQPTIAPRTALGPAGASSSSTAGNIAITSRTALAPADASSLSFASSPVIALRYALAPAPAASTSAADGVGLGSRTALTLAPAVSLSAAGTVTIGTNWQLLPADLESASVETGLALVAHVTRLAKLRLRIAA
jgi:hypothetical protein